MKPELSEERKYAFQEIMDAINGRVDDDTYYYLRKVLKETFEYNDFEKWKNSQNVPTN